MQHRDGRRRRQAAASRPAGLVRGGGAATAVAATEEGWLAALTTEDGSASGRAPRRAEIWGSPDGAWEPVVVVDADGSWLDGCVGSHDGVLVFGSDGAASRSWASTDLSGFTEVDTLRPGLHREAAVAVSGGYAAGGHVRTEEHVGPVLWLSPDGKEWTGSRYRSRRPTPPPPWSRPSATTGSCCTPGCCGRGACRTSPPCSTTSWTNECSDRRRPRRSIGKNCAVGAQGAGGGAGKNCTVGAEGGGLLTLPIDRRPLHISCRGAGRR